MKINLTLDLTIENLDKLKCFVPTTADLDGQLPGQISLFDEPVPEEKSDPASPPAKPKKPRAKPKATPGSTPEPEATPEAAPAPEPEATPEAEPAPEPEVAPAKATALTKTDIRATALELSKANKQAELAAAFKKFGCKKLSDFDDKPELYEDLMKELVSANG